MQTFEHEFTNVEDYLHHRDPYRMVDRIVALTENEIRTEKTFRGDEFFAAGHFPGASIFPGAMMQELSTQTAGILIAAKHNPMRQYNTRDPDFNEFALGVLVRVNQAKYIGFARPGDTLRVHVSLNDRVGPMFDFSTVMTVEGRKIMRNSFRLTNIKSTLLHGQT